MIEKGLYILRNGKMVYVVKNQDGVVITQVTETVSLEESVFEDAVYLGDEE